jgi:antitoxin component YwqK of YwqJK toxin-antitoxin module
MKNILLFVLLTIFSLPNLVAQEVKLKTKDTNEVYEEYYVLDSNKKVKHGSYLKITKPLMGVWGNNYFSLIGNYEMGEKHGAWEQYYPNCNQIEFKGYYKNCLKDSIWIYYYPDIDEKEIREIRTETGTRIEILNINNRISAKGKYRNNEKVGIWEYYNLEQDLIQKYD